MARIEKETLYDYDIIIISKIIIKIFIFNKLNIREKNIIILINAYFLKKNLEREFLETYRARLT